MENLNSTMFVVGFIMYIAIMIGIGTYFSKGKATGKNYITGGNNIPFFLIFATMGATLIGTGSSIGATANGFRSGFGGAAYGLGAAIGAFALAWLVNKTRIRDKNFVTMAEEAQFHYNGNIKVKYVMAVMIYIIELAWLGNHINGGATYLSFVTGIDVTSAKLLTVLGFGVYVIIGGYLAVVWTDLFQLAILLAGFGSIVAVALPMAGGWENISNTIIAAGKEGNLTFYGIGTLGTMAFINLVYGVFIPFFGTPTYRVRVYTAKTHKAAVFGLNLSAILMLVFSLLPAIIGMAAFTMATQNNVTQVLERPDFAFTYMATTVLGPTLGLMFMIAGLSATMSSGDSDAIAGVGILVQDIYPMIYGKEMPAEKVGAFSRVATVVTLLLAFCATMFARDVMGYILNVIGSLIPGVSVAMVFGALWKRATWQACIATVVIGVIFGICFLTIPGFRAWIAGTFAGPAIPATILAVAVEVIVSLCTVNEPKSEEERLQLVQQARG